MNNSTETVFSSISAEDSDLKREINKAKVQAIGEHKYYSYLEDQQKKLSFHNLKTIKDLAKNFNKKPKKKKEYKKFKNRKK